MACLVAIFAAVPEVGLADGEPTETGAGERIAGQPISLVHHDLSAPLTVMAARRRALGLRPRSEGARALSVLRPPDLAARYHGAEPDGDALLRAQRAAPPPIPMATTPAPLVNFSGLDADTSALLASRVAPPDTVGAVGPDHYVQMINLVFVVYDKDGSICGSPGCIPPGGGPFNTSDVWDGFGGSCESENDGDPIVLYDHLADRWLISQFALAGSPVDTQQCIAISQTSDPTGAFHRYAFDLSPGVTRFDDYPKIGLWPDAYVLTVNEFTSDGNSFLGALAFALERQEMIQGNAAGAFRMGPLDCPSDPNAGPCYFSLQPGDLDGPAPPPGTPNPVVMAFDWATWGEADMPGPDGYQLWELDVDWGAPAAGLTELARVDTAEFDAQLCTFPDPCVPQPAPGPVLDSLGQFTMFRAQVRHWGTHQSLVVNHTIDVDIEGERAGIRWAELRRSEGAWSLHQSGTHAPDDGEHRWMGSIAMNGAADIAVGYSLSSDATYPSVVYATRAAADTPGSLPGGEVTLHAGTGAQLASSNRWGDYSSMSVDPVNDCTFWYTQEYYEEDASFDFKTRVGAFAPADCTSLGAGPSPLEFGSLVAPTSATELVTLANLSEGGGSLDVTQLTLSGAPEFSLDTGSGTCASATPTIGSGGECTLGVTLTIAAEGVFDGSLTVESNASVNPQPVLQLSGFSCGTDDKNLSEVAPVTGSKKEVACRTITAGPYPIGDGETAGHVEFLAGEGLILEDGFSVAGGSSFVGGTDSRLIP
jgi:hypothetical protein